MDKDNKNINRRDFFKCCAKATLPIIGGILLSRTETTAKALESVDCNYSCSYSCRHSCHSACMNTCSNACAGNCKSLCNLSCSSSCQNSSKSEPEKLDTTSCPKRELKKKNKKKSSK